MSLHPESCLSLQYILAVAAGKIALGKAAVIDGIQQVGLANTILPAYTYDAAGEIKPGILVILEMGERYGVQ